MEEKEEERKEAEEEEKIQPQLGLRMGLGSTSFRALACLEPEMDNPNLIAPKKKEYLS